MFDKKLNRTEIIISIIIAIFSVIFLWWFWTNWIRALWFNYSIVSLLLMVYFIVSIKELKTFFKMNFYWIIPIVLIALSFSIYENPYIKTINFFVFPAVIWLFFNLSTTYYKWSKTWNLKMIKETFSRKFCLQKAFDVLSEKINRWKYSQVIIKKILTWLLTFLFLNSIIIALLSKADNDFWELISSLVSLINTTTLIKVIISFLIVLFLTAFKLNWKEEFSLKVDSNEEKIDSIISWIVLWWTLITYLLFIFVQIDNILAVSLPTSFNDTVSLVKGWFWQLFFVSIINIVFFFVYYRKTHEIVQKILIAFIFASVIILISAWNRMFLYISNYWISYEKFAASYTILYFWILFVIMISILFLKRRTDIFKIWIILALWMYSVLTIIPMERIIFETNMALIDSKSLKIEKQQSYNLTIDAIDSVKKIKWTYIYQEQNWENWIKESIREVACKKWYEKNIHDFYDYKELGVSDEEMESFRERCG